VLARTSAQGVRIIIPTLRVDAPVVGVGAPGGSLQPPLDPSVLGRWTGGATIGAAHGRALVTGHSVHDGDGALDALASLSRGDLMLVRTPYGLQRQVVTQVRVLTKRELVAASSTLFRQDGPGRLVLVTCTGWNGKSYSSNVVVVARTVTSLQLDRLPRRSVAGE
jgi:LPXTG-site transpeptidase (sortase) family protein